MDYFAIFFTAFGATFVLTLLALKVFPILKIMDKPGNYGLTRKPIPYSGGIIIYLVFVMLVGIFLGFEGKVAVVILTGGMLVLVSFLDDRYNINPWLRLLTQFLVTVLIVIAGIGVDSIRVPWGGVLNLQQFSILLPWGSGFYWLEFLFLLIWILGMTNTLNWVDGVNGMASGIAAIGFGILFFLSVRPNFHYLDQTAVALMSVILGGACLAFVLFEFHPAKILMGDSGTMFLGFMLALLAIFSGGKVATVFLVMGIPILDALWVLTRRIVRGQNPLKGDLRHFYHRLLLAGFSQRSALLIMYFFVAVFGSVALILDNAFSKGILIVLMSLIMVVMGFVVVGKEK